MTKSVCIVGAGPSGLVTAKSLLHDAPRGSFDVTVFEAQPRIGGLWPSHPHDGSGLVHPLMIANQSRHTIQFSDLAWDSETPQMPRAWQIGRYLERYRERYCRDAKLQLGTRVEHAEPVSDGAGWRVQVRRGQDEPESHTFDHLVVAAGFFGRPANVTGATVDTDIPVVHSSRYRDLPTLLDKTAGTGGKILIVGGQMSGVEIAATVASHLSSAMHSPGPSSVSNPGKYTIHHITHRPSWVFPLFTSPKPSSAAPPFLPFDLGSYNLANRNQPLTNSQGHITVEAARTVHSIFETSLGTDQSIFSPLTAIKGEDRDHPAYLAVSDTYLEFVRYGLISISRGKLVSLIGRDATVSPSNEVIHDVAAVILATGFDAASSLSFLPQSIHETLSVVPTDLNNTVGLAFHGTHHPSVPNLGFVGFYRSPYWGVMEMQARFLTALWLVGGGPTSPSLPPSMAAALKHDTSIERTLALRKDPRASQFPMGDYSWLMQEFASALDIARSPPLGDMPCLPPANKKMDILTPARYPSNNITREQRNEMARSLGQTRDTVWAALSSGRFIAKGVFRSLLGRWRLERDIVSRLPTHPSGHFSGTAEFLLRDATTDGREGEFTAAAAQSRGGGNLEYLYVETGDFRADNGMCFRANRRYIWRYDEDEDRLSVWFARTDDPKRVDYLFHKIKFEPDADGAVAEPRARGWHATAGHLCVDDFYNVQYNFHIQGVNLTEWSSGYTVKGPKKDYTIDGTYTREKGG